MGEQVDCFIKAGKEKAWKLRTPLRKPLPKRRISQHFKLWEPTMGVVDGTLEEIWRSTPLFGSSPESPMVIYGFYGPLKKDSIARMVPSAYGYGAKPLDVRLKEQIYESTATHVYAGEVVGGNRDGQRVAIKINYDPHKNLKAEEASAWRDLSKMKKKKGINSLPSLPTVLRGTLVVDGCNDGLSNPEAHLIWPLGECIKGKVFRASQLCKVAFDIVLALYHLALAGRRHRDVCTDNMIFARDSNQFVLIDLKLASEVEDDRTFKRSWPSDCVWLVLSLVELCTLQQWCRAEDIHSAADVLAAENQTLFQFASHVATSYREEEHGSEFLAPWLARLAEACSIAQADLDKLL